MKVVCFLSVAPGDEIKKGGGESQGRDLVDVMAMAITDTERREREQAGDSQEAD